MFKFDKGVWAVLALAGLMPFATTGCKNAASEEAAEEDNLPKEPVPVRAVKVEKTVLKPSIDVVGTLIAIPERTTSVSYSPQDGHLSFGVVLATRAAKACPCRGRPGTRRAPRSRRRRRAPRGPMARCGPGRGTGRPRLRPR